jgi:hypothetical protein
MKVEMTTTLEFDVDEVAAALSPVEMLTLFTRAANRLTEKGSTEERRALARDFAGAMSENAKHMLAEIFAAEYVRLANASVTDAAKSAPDRDRSVVHLCHTSKSGLTSCCHKTPYELPVTDRLTHDPGLVTCKPNAGPSTGDKFLWHTGEVVTVASVDGAMTRLRFNRNDGPEINVPTGLLTNDKRIKSTNPSTAGQEVNSGL